MMFIGINKGEFESIKKVIGYCKKYKTSMIVIIVTNLILTVTSIISPLIWGSLLMYILDKNLSLAMKQALYLVIIYFFETSIKIVNSKFGIESRTSITSQIRTEIFEKILYMPIKILDKYQIGKLISYIQMDSSSIVNFLFNDLLGIIHNVITVAMVGFILFKINVPLAIIMCIGFPMSSIVYARYGKVVKDKNRKLKNFTDKYFNRIYQSIRGIKEIKSLGISEKIREEFMNDMQGIKKTTVEITKNNVAANIITYTVNFVCELSFVFVGSYLIFTNELSVKYFFAFSSYSKIVTKALLDITKFNLSIQETLVSIERIFGFFNKYQDNPSCFGNKKIEQINGNIAFENVCFSYDENKTILSNLSLSINQNSKVAFVGNSGVGKTTIFNLLLRFYTPQYGCIKIDNINLCDIDESFLREYITIINQEPFLFNMSIKDNLKLANNNADEDDIVKCCKKAHIHDFVMSLPNKYDHIIEQDASNFSVGQRQRIAIARALIRKSKIILFDESTSALDNNSEEYIKIIMNDLSKEHTVIVIAHRLSTIIDSDQIFLIDDGRVFANGTHDELMNSSEIYMNLYKSGNLK